MTCPKCYADITDTNRPAQDPTYDYAGCTQCVRWFRDSLGTVMLREIRARAWYVVARTRRF